MLSEGFLGILSLFQPIRASRYLCLRRCYSPKQSQHAIDESEAESAAFTPQHCMKTSSLIQLCQMLFLAVDAEPWTAPLAIISASGRPCYAVRWDARSEPSGRATLGLCARRRDSPHVLKFETVAAKATLPQ